MIFLLSVLISAAHAGFDAKSVFPTTTLVPVELHQEILTHIEAQCPILARQAHTLTETITHIERREIDQQNADLIFHTSLTATVDQGGNPLETRIYVRSFEGGWTNPTVDRWIVESVIGCR